MTIIVVGSLNQVKVRAVSELIEREYTVLFPFAHVSCCNASSRVGEQPLGLKEIIEGAHARATGAFAVQSGDMNANYGFGIESGLIEVPYTRTGCMDITACVIYEGRETYVGLSSAFEHPQQVIDLVLDKGVDISNAYRLTHLTNAKKIGAEKGAIHLLTCGRVDRRQYTQEAIRNALIHLENKESY